MPFKDYLLKERIALEIAHWKDTHNTQIAHWRQYVTPGCALKETHTRNNALNDYVQYSNYALKRMCKIRLYIKGNA